MKIGLLTIEPHINYGGILQAYALKKVLEDVGNHVVIMNSGTYGRSGLKNALSLIKPVLKNVRKPLSIKGEIHKHVLIQNTNIRSFYKKWMIPYLSESNFINCKEDNFDCIVVGSDQVWRRGYGRRIGTYFLDFAKDWNIKRIAYAASFGLSEWQYDRDETNELRTLIKKFNLVTVREDEAKKLLQDNIGIESCVVLDPTMLHTKQNYFALLDEQDIKNNKEGILIYFLQFDNEKVDLIKNLINQTHRRIFSANNFNIDGSVKDCYPSIEEWLSGFANAEYVITDSFHGTVFSILFNNNFVVLENKKGGMSRLVTLLSQLGLEERIAKTEEDVTFLLDKPIEWQQVNEKLENLRIQSRNILIKAL